MDGKRQKITPFGSIATRLLLVLSLREEQGVKVSSFSLYAVNRSDMEELIKECSRVTIECEMRVVPAEGPGPVVQSQTCSFVMGVDVQYPSVETALMNKKTGDRVKVYIPPEEIYGANDPELVLELPRADYKQDRLKPGRMYREIKRKCLVQFLVKEVRDEVIVADFNDPRAGTWAEFDIVVKEVRPAKKEEMKPSCAKTPEFPEW